MVTPSSCLIWQIISFIPLPNEYGCVYDWTTLGNIAALLLLILAKKIIFSDAAHFDLGGYVNKQNCRIWGTENPQAYSEKPTHPKRVTVTVNGDHYRYFCSQKLKRRILATFGFNRTAQCATQPKLHSMFWAQFLKIALSAAELILFGHLPAAIWHRWTIIFGVPSKISISPTSQRQLTL